MTIDELEAEILRLNLSQRASLAHKLLCSLEVLSDAENERLWAEEALRRHEELERGTESARSAEEVFRDVRKQLS